MTLEESKEVIPMMEAMCNIGMAETEGGGIRKLFVQQKILPYANI